MKRAKTTSYKSTRNPLDDPERGRKYWELLVAPEYGKTDTVLDRVYDEHGNIVGATVIPKMTDYYRDRNR